MAEWIGRRIVAVENGGIVYQMILWMQELTTWVEVWSSDDD